MYYLEPEMELISKCHFFLQTLRMPEKYHQAIQPTLLKIHKMSINPDALYTELECRLNYLLKHNHDYLTDDESIEVQKMIYHKEYGLALQSFCYGFISESRPLSKESLTIVDELITKMGMKDESDDYYWLWDKFISAVKRQSQIS
jgi:hypothetical protein